MMMDDTDVSEKVLVRRGRVDSVDLYEVKDNELDILENGEPDSLFLNFSIFLFSIAVSAICSLATATFKSSLIEYAFLFVAIIGLLLGTFLLILWLRRRTSIKSIIKTIRDRIPPNEDDTQAIGINKNKTKTTVASQSIIDNPPPPQG